MAKLWYLASPYSKYANGIEAAFRDISEQAGWLANNGVFVFSPIAHTHPIATYGKLDHYDYDLMLAWDKLMIDRCDGMLICMLPGYDTSYGVAWEKEQFEKQGKPIVYISPFAIPELSNDQ